MLGGCIDPCGQCYTDHWSLRSDPSTRCPVWCLLIWFVKNAPFWSLFYWRIQAEPNPSPQWLLLNNFYNYPVASDEHIRVAVLAWGVLKSMQTALLASWIMFIFGSRTHWGWALIHLAWLVLFQLCIIFPFHSHRWPLMQLLESSCSSYWTIDPWMFCLLSVCFSFICRCPCTGQLWVLPFPAVCQTLTPPPLWHHSSVMGQPWVSVGKR